MPAGALLGCSPADLRPGARFTDLGIDSLSALLFSMLLQDVFEVEVPVGVVLSPAERPAAIADHIEAARGATSKRPTFAAVHGTGSTEIRAGDITLEKFVDARTLDGAHQLARPSGQPPHTVLLTGATGFLGRFMCLDRLEHAAATGGRLICLVRGRDAADARARLDAAFTSGDAELLRLYQDLAARHLEVLAGDIGEESLGLDQDVWQRLAADVDLVLHPAALVNHVLPYNQLFDANVVGTAELIRLALTTKVKPLTYVSTIGVSAEQDPQLLDEDADIRETMPDRHVGDGYGNGYSISKWAGEVLLRQAHDACGLPVTVLRSDMILAHTRHTGQLNVPDIFTRLLFSLAATGIAPASFYRADARGNRQRAHYDGLPVDFVAQAVNTLGARHGDGYRTYNVTNPHDDGVSLDTFVDWLGGTGHPLHLVEDYDEWVTRFETALRALPETRRRHSLLPLMHAFRQPDEPSQGSQIPSVRFEEAVREAEIGGAKEIPHLSEELITKYMADLHALELL